MTTFNEQSEKWISELQNRKRHPAQESSLTAFRSHLNWLQPRIGNIELESITNRTLRELVPELEKGRQPKTVSCYLTTVKAVVESELDEDGEPLHKRKWNSDFIDAPLIGKQKQPTFTPEQVADIIANGNGTGMLIKTAAGSGLRIGELLGLERRHFNNRTLTVEQTLWGHRVKTPKTVNAYRDVDLCISLADELKDYAGTRPGFIFDSQRTYSGALMRLHEILEHLKIERTGFHAFRRFRKTHMGKMKVPRDLQKYWLGHADSNVTDSYDAVESDLEFRLNEAERCGLGF